jgi:hypothetical protein
MLGIDDKELLRYFTPFLEEAAAKHGVTLEEMVEMIGSYYDGFCFDGKTMLYNLYSLLLFFRGDYEFSNYWMTSGSTSLISKYLKQRHLTVEQFRNFPVSRDFVRSPGNIDTAPPEGFLFQGGYLSLRPGTANDFALDYPNKEVLDSMSMLLSENMLGGKEELHNFQNRFFIAMYNRDVEEVVTVFNGLLRSIPYDDFISAAKESVKFQGFKFPAQEWLYRSTLLAFLHGMGVVVSGEVHNNKGRTDMVVTRKGRTLVIEVKVAYQGESLDAKLGEAVTQIEKNDYTGAYDNAIALGMVIEDEKRQIACWKTV